MALTSRQGVQRAAAGHVDPVKPRQQVMVARAARQQNQTSNGSASDRAARQEQQHQQQHSRRALLGLAVAAAAVALPRVPSARAESAPYLLSNGGRGILAEEEAKLLQLRKELEVRAGAIVCCVLWCRVTGGVLQVLQRGGPLSMLAVTQPLTFSPAPHTHTTADRRQGEVRRELEADRAAFEKEVREDREAAVRALWLWGSGSLALALAGLGLWLWGFGIGWGPLMVLCFVLRSTAGA